MRVAFLGTPDFAVPSLDALVRAGHQVVAVYVQPDKPKGRGGKVTPPPVKARAEELGLPVFQPKRIRNSKWVEHLKSLSLDCMITVAFGQILSAENLAAPRLGCINVHGSLLPAYRGPAPIQWAILRGESKTGVTTMMTNCGVDTGDMLLKREIDILPEDTAGALSERMSVVGAELLVETLERLSAGDLRPEPQDEALASYYPMLEKAHGHIDWNQTARAIVDQTRGVNPWPGAYAAFPGGILKIWRAKCADAFLGADAPNGAIVVSDAKKGLIVSCEGGAAEILELQAPNGKRMPAADFLRGKGALLPVGTRFE